MALIDGPGKTAWKNPGKRDPLPYRFVFELRAPTVVERIGIIGAGTRPGRLAGGSARGIAIEASATGPDKGFAPPRQLEVQAEGETLLAEADGAPVWWLRFTVVSNHGSPIWTYWNEAVVHGRQTALTDPWNFTGVYQAGRNGRERHRCGAPDASGQGGIRPGGEQPHGGWPRAEQAGRSGPAVTVGEPARKWETGRSRETDGERVESMTDRRLRRAHLITGGFPAGSAAGHDHDYARLRLLEMLEEQEIQASVGNDFADVGKWLPLSQLLITYVAGPYPDAEQSRVIQEWLRGGGHWLGLHGTSGGKAERVEGQRQRRTVKTEHHAVLGAFFLTHPPQCRFRVDAVEDHPLLYDVSPSFEIEDEPYFIELQNPGATRVLLTADYGARAVSTVVEPLYGSDTSLLADGHTRVIAYTMPVGQGAVTYCALGHCHNPATRPNRAGDPNDTTPPAFRGTWESRWFLMFLRNAIAWDLVD